MSRMKGRRAPNTDTKDFLIWSRCPHLSAGHLAHDPHEFIIKVDQQSDLLAKCTGCRMSYMLTMRLVQNGTGQSRVAQCHRYGRYICVKILEGWGKKVWETTEFCKLK